MIRQAIDYGLSFVGAPYVWWTDGPVPDRSPAWAENAPPPSPEEVINEGCFCAGVPNLLLRFAGGEIPTLGDELYDGGCLAYGEYYNYYGVAEEFDINEDYPEGTLIGRYFTWDRSANGDQGHVAVVLEGGYLLQSYDAGGGYPGVNADAHITDSHAGYYYEYAVRPWNWLGQEEEEAADLEVVSEAADLGAQQTAIDDFIWYCQQLKGPNYRYEGGRDGSTYEQCLTDGEYPGVDCSGMFDVVLRFMGLKDDTPIGTVAISEMLVDWEPYDPDKLYPKGTVIVNDNATGWVTGDDSHVAMIIEDYPMFEGYPGQRLLHSWNPKGVDDTGTDVESHQYSHYEWAGFLPMLIPEPGADATVLDPVDSAERQASGWLGPDGGVSLEQLQSIMPNLTYAEEYLPYLNEAMAEAEINTPLRQGAFLAQLAHESGELQWFEEFADGWDYEWREDLGNIYEGDGPLYKGRGPIQLTGRHNYTMAGEALGLDLVNDPWQVASPEVGFRTACWYWNYGSAWGDLNVYADAGDFDSTCLGVNGGWNGYDERCRYYNVACGVLGA